MADVLTPKQRSYCMSRIRSTNTTIELLIKRELTLRGLKFKRNYSKLPGSPDFVFEKKRVAVFVDGDFWHGYRFPAWKKRLSKLWTEKITRNRKRDLKNFRKLRRAGWKVLRFWGHEVEKSPGKCVGRLMLAIRTQ